MTLKRNNINSNAIRVLKLVENEALHLDSRVTTSKVLNSNWSLAAILNFSGHIRIKKTSISEIDTYKLVDIPANCVALSKKMQSLCCATPLQVNTQH